MVILALVTVGAIGTSSRDSILSVHRLDSIQAMYAAEAGMNMAIREMKLGVDEDADGVVGSTSDDANDANNPAVGRATVVVTRTDASGEATLTTSGTSGLARRSTEATMAPGVGMNLPLEMGSVDVGVIPTTVNLLKTYTSPVVVCTPNYDNNTLPFVARVDSVTSTSFDVRLQSPGDLITPTTERAWYMVMEAGAHTVNGVKCEAQTYLSTVTDRKAGGQWNGQVQTYLHTYTNPVVFGQVMTRNDADWSVFWCRGSSKSVPPNASTLRTGKHVAEDPDNTRADETVGFIVFERGAGTMDGIDMDAALSAKNIRGISNSPPFFVPFNGVLSSAPEFVLVGMSSMNGGDGGWALVYGPSPTTTAGIDTTVDEDQVGDSDRSHTNEYVSVLAFESATLRALLLTWDEVAP